MANSYLTVGETPQSAPAVEPVTVGDMIGSATSFTREPTQDQQGNLTLWLPSARRLVEEFTNRQLITATWRFTADAFPAWEWVMPSKRPWQSISAITYVATDGTSTVLASSDYRFVAATGVLEPAYGGSWPSTRDVSGAVTVDVVCGFGATAASVLAADARYIHGIKALVIDWMENHALRFAMTPGVRELLMPLHDGRYWG